MSLAWRNQIRSDVVNKHFEEREKRERAIEEQRKRRQRAMEARKLEQSTDTYFKGGHWEDVDESLSDGE